MAFVMKIGAIRVFAEKAVAERDGVWTGIGVSSQAIVKVVTLTGSCAKIGIGVCSGRIHQCTFRKNSCKFILVLVEETPMAGCADTRIFSTG